MNHIIVLNWNASRQTINCIESLLNLNKLSDVRVIVCDNDSDESSYNEIFEYMSANSKISFSEVLEGEEKIYDYQKKFYLIKNKKNYGYAGGNNVGIRFSMLFKDVVNVWILNNDTIVLPDSLDKLIEKINSMESYGVIGSKLVSLKDKLSVQGVGGKINTWFCSTKEVGSKLKIFDNINETEYEKKIDFVIGASMLVSRKCVEDIGYLCEDFFLYYEEIDYCNRAKMKGYEIGIASNSIVFHEHGASTEKGKSDIADFCSVRNRLIISQKYYRNRNWVCRASIVGVCIIRLYRLQFSRAYKYLNFVFGSFKNEKN